MSEYIRQEINLNNYVNYVNEIADKIQRSANQTALDKAADTLAEYGYVKVVLCRDCEFEDEAWNCAAPYFKEPDGYCRWASRKVDA